MDLQISNVDVALDTHRIALSCTNPGCEVEELTVVATRGGRAHARADVQALWAIDDGTEAEQRADGAVLRYDDDGEFIGSEQGAEYFRRRSRGERDHETLRRRTRLSKIDVQPFPWS